MTWMEVSLEMSHEAVDWVRTLLAQTDTMDHFRLVSPEAIAPDDAIASLDPADKPSDWDLVAFLYLPNDLQTRPRLEAIDDLLAPLRRLGLVSALHTAVVAAKPDLATEATSPAHEIGEKFTVRSPEMGDRPTTDDRIALQLNSSASFGSGFHPTTILNLRLLERHVMPAMSTLDFGTGSGILSIAMAKLGAQVVALDNDAIAVAAAQDAVQHNDVADQVTVLQGSLGCGNDLGNWMGGESSKTGADLTADASFDLIAANVPARILIVLAETFRQILDQPSDQPGLLSVSGFTIDAEADLMNAFTQAGFQAIDREQMEEWVGLLFRLT